MSMFGNAKKTRAFNGNVAGVPFAFDTHKTAGDTSDSPSPERNPYENVEIAAAYADIAKDLITHAALTIGGVVAGVAIIKRICR